MPSNFTEHYHLSQWEADDIVKREDFNADNRKIEAAIDGQLKILTGTYDGDLAESRFINLGVTPKAVLLFTSLGTTRAPSNYASYGGLALPDAPVRTSSSMVVEIVENGFMVYFKKDTVFSNSSNTFHYLAFV